MNTGSLELSSLAITTMADSITSPEVQELFKCDVFLHANQATSIHIGGVVNFIVLVSKDHKPQAFDVLPRKHDTGKRGSKFLSS